VAEFARIPRDDVAELSARSDSTTPRGTSAICSSTSQCAGRWRPACCGCAPDAPPGPSARPSGTCPCSTTRPPCGSECCPPWTSPTWRSLRALTLLASALGILTRDGDGRWAATGLGRVYAALTRLPREELDDDSYDEDSLIGIPGDQQEPGFVLKVGLTPLGVWRRLRLPGQLTALPHVVQGCHRPVLL
jgi:hypothetical protein